LLGGCGGSGDDGDTGSSSRGFYGVISAEPLPGAAQLAQLGRGKVGTLRINLAWGSVQSGPDAPYDWSHYDDVVGEAAKNGIRVLATVYSSPTWAEPSPEYPPLGDRTPEFEDFARAAVRRYGSDGSFWREHSDLPKMPIVDWQLWNEPNSLLFWKPAPDPAAYLQLLRGFGSAVKGADPAAQILLGGLFPTPRGGMRMDDFLSYLYDHDGKDLFDAVAVHPYAADPANALDSVETARGIIDRFDDPDASLWITEVGWASGGEPSGLTVGPRRQAAYLRETFQMAADNRERLNLDGVIWYSLNDTPGRLWPGHCGLFTLDGTAKPSWSALTALTGGS
jgi:hypothetical protein